MNEEEIFHQALALSFAGGACGVSPAGVRGRSGAARVDRGAAAGERGASGFMERPASGLGAGIDRPIRRGSGHGHRPVQAAGADRRGRHGRRLHGRADPARAPQGRAEDHQARHGHEAGHRPLRGRAPGPGPDGSPQHRPHPRRRGHRIRPALLRHGAGPRHPDHRVLRPQPPRASPSGSTSSSRSARRSSMPIRRGSSTAT